MPEVGDEFTVRTSLLSKVGSAFSIVFKGARIGLGRVVEDFHNDERYSSDVHGGGRRNLGFHMYKIRTERIFGEDDE